MMMFNQREIESYKNIKAPSELYQKVVLAKKKNNLWILPTLSTVAACFVMVIALSFFFKGEGPDIILNGQSLESSIVYYDVAPASQMRSAAVLHVPMKVDVSCDTEISVSAGQITVNNSNPCKTVTVTDSSNLQWEIPHDELNNECVIKMQDKNGTTIVTLKYNNTKITVTKRRTEK